MQFHCFGCFLTNTKQWAIPEKIDEFDPVFPLQKIEKGKFYSTIIAVGVIVFQKLGYSIKSVLSLIAAASQCGWWLW